MEKDQKINVENQNDEANEVAKGEHNNDEQQDTLNNDEQQDTLKDDEKIKEISPEEKIKELEDKVIRTFAEMENQRRRFEKEKEDAFDYGGFLFAKEALAIIDNLERSKQVLENDEKLKNSEALKKTLDHLKIISTDLISVFQKNNI